MSSLIIGFVFICGIVAATLEGGTGNYIQFKSIAIVIFGTMAILLFATPVRVLRSLLKSVGALFGREETITDYHAILANLVRDRSLGGVKSDNPLISYAADLWQQGVSADLFAVLLSQKRRELVSKGNDAVHALKNLAKYPPALGMTGTVMGMVSLFSSLDQNKDSVGSNLSIAMTATFLGLILANLLIAPLADRLHVRQVCQERLHDNVYEVLLLVNQGEPAALIKEELNERAA